VRLKKQQNSKPLKNIMKLYYRLLYILFLTLMCAQSDAQTAGVNYQALILGEDKIQIPGSNVVKDRAPLALADVYFRFTITSDSNTEYYREEQSTVTDEYGLISLIVGEGVPIYSTFNKIIWDGTPKYLNVEINILKDGLGYVFLDLQKILYLPQSVNGKANVSIVTSVPPESGNTIGELVWVKDADGKGNPSLKIWDGSAWVFVNNDYDPKNELGPTVVTSNADRDVKFPIPVVGNQVWNRVCGCVQVYDGGSWIFIGQGGATTTDAGNGLTKNGNTIELGGALTKPTTITATSTNTLAITGLGTGDINTDELVVIDKTTGTLKTVAASALLQEKQKIVIANNGQTEFVTPLPIVDLEKINVYRNGIRIDVTMVNATTIKLEAGVVCYQNDEIRIVQFN
jgi:hypothetical protein